MRLARKQRKTKFWHFQSGPYRGISMKMSSMGTLPFRMGEWYGYYDKENKWVDLNGK